VNSLGIVDRGANLRRQDGLGRHRYRATPGVQARSWAGRGDETFEAMARRLVATLRSMRPRRRFAWLDRPSARATAPVTFQSNIPMIS
jgi:hypothetical protein